MLLGDTTVTICQRVVTISDKLAQTVPFRPFDMLPDNVIKDMHDLAITITTDPDRRVARRSEATDRTNLPIDQTPPHHRGPDSTRYAGTPAPVTTPTC